MSRLEIINPKDVSAMSAFRYIYHNQEISKRVLELTAEIVKLNPAHYSVWYATTNETPLSCPLHEKEQCTDQYPISSSGHIAGRFCFH